MKNTEEKDRPALPVIFSVVEPTVLKALDQALDLVNAVALALDRHNDGFVLSSFARDEMEDWIKEIQEDLVNFPGALLQFEEEELEERKEREKANADEAA